jgi:hypothetical protein
MKEYESTITTITTTKCSLAVRRRSKPAPWAGGWLLVVALVAIRSFDFAFFRLRAAFQLSYWRERLSSILKRRSKMSNRIHPFTHAQSLISLIIYDVTENSNTAYSTVPGTRYPKLVKNPLSQRRAPTAHASRPNTTDYHREPPRT